MCESAPHRDLVIRSGPVGHFYSGQKNSSEFPKRMRVVDFDLCTSGLAGLGVGRRLDPPLDNQKSKPDKLQEPRSQHHCKNQLQDARRRSAARTGRHRKKQSENYRCHGKVTLEITLRLELRLDRSFYRVVADKAKT